jgi:hypothetical protein
LKDTPLYGTANNVRWHHETERLTVDSRPVAPSIEIMDIQMHMELGYIQEQRTIHTII